MQTAPAAGSDAALDELAAVRLEAAEKHRQWLALRAAAAELQHASTSGEEEEDPIERLRLARLPLRPRTRRLAARAVATGWCNEHALALLLSVSWRTLLLCAAWYAVSRVALRHGVGQPFILLSIVALVLANFGRRKPGEASAYSLFNANKRALPGAIPREELERQLRGGHF